MQDGMTEKDIPFDLGSVIKILVFLIAVAGILFLVVKGIVQFFIPPATNEGESDIIDAEWRIKE